MKGTFKNFYVKVWYIEKPHGRLSLLYSLMLINKLPINTESDPLFPWKQVVICVISKEVLLGYVRKWERFQQRGQQKEQGNVCETPKVAFGETSEGGGKGRELKEPLVSPAVIGSLNTWSQGFPKTRNRKYNSFPHRLPPPLPSTPSSKQVFPQMNIFRLESFPLAGNVQRSLLEPNTII